MFSIIKILLLFFIYNVYAAPVRKGEAKSAESHIFKGVFRISQTNNYSINPSNDLHYKEYLDEIIKELESDKNFADRIKDAQAHNRTEHIAQSLQFVHHRIRSRLDEIKRREIERLNVLENEMERRKLEAKGYKVPPPDPKLKSLVSFDKEHLDHYNVHTFEMSDLEKLIKKVEDDLLKVDKQQEEQFKEHEMKKEHLKKKALEAVKDEDKRKKLEEQMKESEIRHKNHSKVHHPGSEEQLKEVWDKNDHLDPKEFNPKAFFDLHDVNGDGHLDINEIESLMQNELSKVYEANNSDDDMQEKYHEMMRMRLEMMKIIDKNKDNLISKDEFLQYSQTTNFKDDTEWKTQEEDGQKPYSEGEFKNFEDDYNMNESEDDDDFSDQDDSLRHIPKQDKNFPVPPPNVNEIKKNEEHKLPPVQSDLKAPNQNAPPPKL